MPCRGIPRPHGEPPTHRVIVFSWLRLRGLNAAVGSVCRQPEPTLRAEMRQPRSLVIYSALPSRTSLLRVGLHLFFRLCATDNDRCTNTLLCSLEPFVRASYGGQASALPTDPPPAWSATNPSRHRVPARHRVLQPRCNSFRNELTDLAETAISRSSGRSEAIQQTDPLPARGTGRPSPHRVFVTLSWCERGRRVRLPAAGAPPSRLAAPTS